MFIHHSGQSYEKSLSDPILVLTKTEIDVGIDGQTDRRTKRVVEPRARTEKEIRPTSVSPSEHQHKTNGSLVISTVLLTVK